MKQVLFKILAESPVSYPLKKLSGDFVPVFMLHRIADSEAGVEGAGIPFLENCLEYIHRFHYKPISLETLCRLRREGEPLPPRSVVFTIDDGFEEQIRLGGEIFSRFDVPLTCFVITDFIDKKIWPWDDQVKYILRNISSPCLKFRFPDGEPCLLEKAGLSDRLNAARKIRAYLKTCPQKAIYEWLDSFYVDSGVSKPLSPPKGYLPTSWQAINDFTKKGHAVGAHTCTHRILSQLDAEEAKSEIVDSISRLQACVENVANVFAYPTGRLNDFTQRDENLLEKLEVLGSVSTCAESVTVDSRLQALPRFSLPKSMATFIQYLSYIETLRNRFRH